jgi:hypothetical protein
MYFYRKCIFKILVVFRLIFSLIYIYYVIEFLFLVRSWLGYVAWWYQQKIIVANCYSHYLCTTFHVFLDATLTLLWRYSDATLMLLWCSSDAPLTLLWRYSDASLTLLETTRRYSTLLDTTRCYLILLDASRHYSTLFGATHNINAMVTVVWLMKGKLLSGSNIILTYFLKVIIIQGN